MDVFKLRHDFNGTESQDSWAQILLSLLSLENT